MSTRRKIPHRSNRRDSGLEKDDENLSNVDDQYINTHVQLTYDVLTIIFKNLNAKDLRMAARVCRCWSEAANNEKRVRGAAPFILFGNMIDSWNDLCPGKSLIDDLRIKPMLSLTFTRPFDAKHPSSMENNVDCPCRILPSKCPNVTVGNHGIVKDHLESEDPFKTVFMLLPENRGITIETVFAPLSRKNEDYCSLSPVTRIDCDIPSTLSSIERLKKLGSAKNKLKCFVIFSSEEFRSCSAVLKSLPRDRERTLSGVVASNLTLCMNDTKTKFCNKPMAWIGILISGPGVRCWSEVLRRSTKTKQAVEEKLIKLRKRVELRKHSVGFMFACEGRGEYMFHEPNVESMIFKKVFPEIPLVGCSGGGEYGNSSIGKLTKIKYV